MGRFFYKRGDIMKLLKLQKGLPSHMYINLEGEAFDDEAMRYDIEEHRYVLNKNYVKNKLNIDLASELGDETTADVFLDGISSFIYGYMKRYHRPGE